MAESLQVSGGLVRSDSLLVVVSESWCWIASAGALRLDAADSSTLRPAEAREATVDATELAE